MPRLRSFPGREAAPPPQVVASFRPEPKKHLADEEVGDDSGHEDDTLNTHGVAEHEQQGGGADHEADGGLQQLGGDATGTDPAIPIEGPHTPARTRIPTRAATGEEAAESPDRDREEHPRRGRVQEQADRQLECEQNDNGRDGGNDKEPVDGPASEERLWPWAWMECRIPHLCSEQARHQRDQRHDERFADRDVLAHQDRRLDDERNKDAKRA